MQPGAWGVDRRPRRRHAGRGGRLQLYPTKNLGALGDGGLVCTADPSRAARLARLRQYGWDYARISNEPGLNSRLDDEQAAILRVLLPGLDRGNAPRRAIAAAYDDALSRSGTAPPRRRTSCIPAFHQYVIRAPAGASRPELRSTLQDQGVSTAIHYWPPLHRQPAYAGRLALGPLGCRRTEQAAREVVSLPIHPQLSEAQVDTVCAALRRL